MCWEYQYYLQIHQTIYCTMNNFQFSEEILHFLFFYFLSNFLIFFFKIKIEYTNRLGHSWKLQFKSETEEIKLTAAINKILLENILPAHVAAYFIRSYRKNEV